MNASRAPAPQAVEPPNPNTFLDEAAPFGGFHVRRNPFSSTFTGLLACELARPYTCERHECPSFPEGQITGPSERSEGSCSASPRNRRDVAASASMTTMHRRVAPARSQVDRTDASNPDADLAFVCRLRGMSPRAR